MEHTVHGHLAEAVPLGDVELSLRPALERHIRMHHGIRRVMRQKAQRIAALGGRGGRENHCAQEPAALFVVHAAAQFRQRPGPFGGKHTVSKQRIRPVGAHFIGRRTGRMLPALCQRRAGDADMCICFGHIDQNLSRWGLRAGPRPSRTWAVRIFYFPAPSFFSMRGSTPK